MDTQHLLIYTLVFLSGAFVLYLLQKLICLTAGKEANRHPVTMDTGTIRDMVNNYRSNHLAAINKALGINDANSAAFGLKTLKKFIADIEYYSKKTDPRITDSLLGVRFYYAAYPEDMKQVGFENEKTQKDYAYKHTLIMIPTLKKKIDSGNSLDYDFNPLDSTTFLLNDRIENKPVEMMVLNTESSDDKQPHLLMALNHGQLIPPAQAVQQYF